MKSFSVTVEFATAQEAAAFLSSLGAGAAPQPVYAPPPVAAPAPAYVPPVAPAQPVYTPPPVAVPAPTPAAAQWTTATIIPVMQAYASKFKVTGLQAVFAKYGAQPNIQQCTPEQLQLVGNHFQSMQPV